ncbi:carbohydrate kinase [Edaphobacillus lindanitolerans]|uniref:Sugar or nucleoside kinase, ribokinase family n=1 Tax=Edaphobacillus lindanitolerans TaxID=550447 RepID=A0A1U7PPT1_9BACI|nr:PfkB family carbohydrate kinase [Edaphobacillus lindanitolerans]SIT88158.1 Sugar or nucleoside kinase, ribokinase family [Edaphobacillus lindanitolerans]
MTDKESAIVALLRQNPYLTQQEMAETLGMSRPALANLISGLTRRGVIKGRAYVLAEENRVVVVGGANVDRKFHLKAPIQAGTSNPSNVTVSVGGVARNVAENLGRLGHPVSLLTVAGPDADWQRIEEASAGHIDLTHAAQLPGRTTGSYSAVLSPDGEMAVALADMEVYDHLTPEYIDAHRSALAGAALIAIDLNCPADTVRHVQRIALEERTPLAVVPVSSPKMDRMPDDLSGVAWFICNRDEAETYTGISIRDDASWREAVQVLLSKGAESVAVTSGSGGVMAGKRDAEISRFPAVPGVRVEDVTGAGDAFVSGVLHGHLAGRLFGESVRLGLANAAKTLGSPHTVRPELTEAQLESEMEELQ